MVAGAATKFKKVVAVQRKQTVQKKLDLRQQGELERQKRVTQM
jgi:hypothetical protein